MTTRFFHYEDIFRHWCLNELHIKPKLKWKQVTFWSVLGILFKENVQLCSPFYTTFLWNISRHILVLLPIQRPRITNVECNLDLGNFFRKLFLIPPFLFSVLYPPLEHDVLLGWLIWQRSVNLIVWCYTWDTRDWFPVLAQNLFAPTKTM